jgi:GT2 family glycosyltransferase
MISLIIPTTSKNKNYTENLVNNIQSLYGDTVEIIVEENDTVTLGINYNNAVARATGEKIILLHNDMIMSPGFVETMDKHITKNRITTYTRVEPPIFNDEYPGKIILDCGSDISTFNSNIFTQYKPNYELINGGSQLFFGCMREDYIGIDGDTFKMFCEDDDLHNRYRLLGFEYKVSCAAVYHFVSKTSRSTTNYQQIELASNRNYVRKWGSRSEAPKYNIAFIVKNCTSDVLELLEPWCDRIYIEDDMQVITTHYIDREQPNTKFDLTKRVLHIGYNDPHGENDIVVEFDKLQLTNQDFMYIQQLASIIQDSGEIGDFQLGNLKISVYSVETYEKNLINVI